PALARAGVSRCGLAGEAARIEKRALLVCRFAAERAIAMGKPPEPADDVGMNLGMFDGLLVARLAAQRDAALLVGQILGVHERQMEEAPLGKRKWPVDPPRDRPLGDRARLGVGRIGARVTPEQVAGKLIEQDEKRKRSLRRRLPIAEPAGGRRLVGRKKSR